MAAAVRYEELGIAEALRRPYDYPTACQELAFILRSAYASLPKSLHSLVFRDTLDAFRRLPEVQSSSGVSSANILLQAAEAALPRQKKAVAISEFKHAVVAQKRRLKTQQGGETRDLPHDVLVHLFSFLDFRSLVAASAVSWAWHAASSEETLWYSQYSLFFDKHGMLFKTGSSGIDRTTIIISAKESFKSRYKGNSPRRSLSNRALCKQCKCMLWLSCMSCAWSHQCRKSKDGRSQIRPMPPNKVVDYLLDYAIEAVPSSESDGNDSDEFSRLSKWWAYPSLSGMLHHSS